MAHYVYVPTGYNLLLQSLQLESADSVPAENLHPLQSILSCNRVEERRDPDYLLVIVYRYSPGLFFSAYILQGAL